MVVLEPRPVEPWNISCEGRGAVCGYLESILVGVRARVRVWVRGLGLGEGLG